MSFATFPLFIGLAFSLFDVSHSGAGFEGAEDISFSLLDESGAGAGLAAEDSGLVPLLELAEVLGVSLG